MALDLSTNTVDSFGARLLNYKGLVTDGLLCFLDAGNGSSYDGTGSTWYDLTGNGNNATFVGNASWNNSNGGTMVTTATNGRFTTSTLNLSASNFTVIAGSRYAATKERIVSGLSNNWLLGHWGNSVANYYSVGWITASGAGGSDTNWRVYAGTGVIGGTYNFYINGILNASGSGGTAGPNNFSIGSYGPGGSEYSDGNVAFLLVYNRVLTSTEIFKTYQNFRRRLGV
jgi:hypothetical protein